MNILIGTKLLPDAPAMRETRTDAVSLIRRNPDHMSRSQLLLVAPAEFLVAHSFEQE